MAWFEIIFSVISLVFMGYIILSIEWHDRQIKALILLSQATHNHLKEMENSIGEIAQSTRQIEMHTARAVKSHYEQDQWDRENP